MFLGNFGIICNILFNSLNFSLGKITGSSPHQTETALSSKNIIRKLDNPTYFICDVTLFFSFLGFQADYSGSILESSFRGYFREVG